jgi:hypothetical protein
VADFLSKILSGLYRQDQNGYFPLGLTDSRRWFEQQIRNSSRFAAVLDQIPVLSCDLSCERDWYQIIHDLAAKESAVRLFIRQDIKQFSPKNPLEKIWLHSLAVLTQFPNVEVYTISDATNYPAGMYLESGSNAYAVQWASGINPFTERADIELSVLKSFLQKVREDFNVLVRKHSDSKRNFCQIEELLQGTKIIRIKPGTAQSWGDILLPYLPDSIQEVKIHDRYIRNVYQFKSLEMFLDALEQKAGADGINVEITTADDEKTDIQSQFRKIQNDYKDKGIKIRYNIWELKEIPHYRKIQIKSETENISLRLDKGLDIFDFDNISKMSFKTVETYIVIEMSS